MQQDVSTLKTMLDACMIDKYKILKLIYSQIGQIKESFGFGNAETSNNTAPDPDRDTESILKQAQEIRSRDNKR